MTADSPPYTAEQLAAYPAPELFHLLVRNEDRVPRNLIDECARRGDEMLDVLEPILPKDYYWSDDSTEGEWWVRFHAVMIMGLVASSRAGTLLVAFMRRMDEARDEELEEWLSGEWPALFRNKPDDCVELLQTLADDSTAGVYMRAEAAQVAVALAYWADAGTLEAALAWAARAAFRNGEDPLFRAITGSMLLDFARPEFRKKLEQIADEHVAHEGLFDRTDITHAYFSRGRAPQWEWENFKNPWSFYEPEMMAERQIQWAEADTAAAQHDVVAQETFRRESPKVGRNDPCPCGSEKKYKKCCGA